MTEPLVPPLRRQVVTHHPVEKSLRAVIALQVVAGMGLIGTLTVARMMQPQPAPSQCQWSVGAPSESAVVSLGDARLPKISAGSVEMCGTARITNTGNPRNFEIRFDNCADGVQPGPIALPLAPTEPLPLPGQPTPF